MPGKPSGGVGTGGNAVAVLAARKNGNPTEDAKNGKLQPNVQKGMDDEEHVDFTYTTLIISK